MRPSPKSLFQKLNKEAATALGVAVEERWFQTATTAAMAQMAEDGCSAEELRGAKSFLNSLCELHVETPPQAILPDKSGLKAFEPPPEPVEEATAET